MGYWCGHGPCPHCGHGHWHHCGHVYPPPYQDYPVYPPSYEPPSYEPAPYPARRRRRRRGGRDEGDLEDYLQHLEEEIGRVRGELAELRSGEGEGGGEEE